MADEIYTVKELTAMLKISESTLYRMLRRGELKSSKVGRAYRITEGDLKRFLDEHTTPRRGEYAEFIEH